jgi:hypothetical protein
MSTHNYTFCLRQILKYIGIVIITLPGTHLLANDNNDKISSIESKWDNLLIEDSSAKYSSPISSISTFFYISTENKQVSQAAIEAEKLIKGYFKNENLDALLSQHFSTRKPVTKNIWIEKIALLKQLVSCDKYNLPIKLVPSSDLNYGMSTLITSKTTSSPVIALNNNWIGYGMKTEAIIQVILKETANAIEFYLNDGAKTGSENPFSTFLMESYYQEKDSN